MKKLFFTLDLDPRQKPTLSWMRIENVKQPKQPKTVFVNRTRNNATNPTNLKRLVPIERDLSSAYFAERKRQQVFFFLFLFGFER